MASQASPEIIISGKQSLEGQICHTFFIPQKVMFDPAAWEKVTANLERLRPLVESGRVVYTHYEDVIEKWKAAGAEPSIIQYDEMDPSLRTCL